MTNVVYVFGYGAFGTSITYALNFNIDNQVFVYDKKFLISEKKWEEYNIQERTGIDTSRIKSTSIINFVENSYIFLVIPSMSIDSWVKENKQYVNDSNIIVNLAKGFSDKGTLIIDNLEKEFPKNKIFTIKGPSFANEILRGYPTLLTIAGRYGDLHLEHLINLFKNSNLVFEYSSDYKGIEVLSVLKNIYSIFIGIVNAKYDAANTTFLSFTKAFKEMEILLTIYGGDSKSLLSSAGIGDFGLTGLNDMSRNRTFGLFVGKGFYDKRNKHSILVEGTRSIEIVHNKALNAGCLTKLPILSFLYSLFFKDGEINDLNKILYA